MFSKQRHGFFSYKLVSRQQACLLKRSIALHGNVGSYICIITYPQHLLYRESGIHLLLCV